ncbi:MAG: hypothetical protein A2Y62_04550 [Candidatus Fischerbacteria bacterium RBG_13_37_8]|uniref:Cyclic nucleotide-binding domain-containing protein n=1 Tax=Candidatus Fischerbacteria bacterium RBG_13_37_8 TaxID=1817863 RepID=A0A1F5VX52_9BACT|nr:MAG: hypothetical protein A2Y62_04550 [Candidatus Fischerbacteria bacterium RBG_13_37_8]
MIDIEEALKKSILFEALTESERKVIADKTEKILVKIDDYIVKEDESSTYIIILLKGQARAILHLEDYEMLLSTLQPYAIIGEITFIDKQPASADVIAEEPCFIAKISHTTLKEIMDQSPAIASKLWEGCAKLLALRIRRSNEMMRNYFGINKALCSNPDFRNFFSYCYYSPR